MTAHAFVLDEAAKATPSTAPASAAGSCARVHAVPFQCQISGATRAPPPTAHASVAEVAATSVSSPPVRGTGACRTVVPVTRTMSGRMSPPFSPFPLLPTAHAPPGNKATANRKLTRGSARLLSVLQAVPLHSATRALPVEAFPVQPTATALLDDRAAMPPQLPATGGMSHPECWPVPAAEALAVGTVVQVSPPGAGDDGWHEAALAAAMAAAATIPARRRRLGRGFTCPPGRGPFLNSKAAGPPARLAAKYPRSWN